LVGQQLTKIDSREKEETTETEENEQLLHPLVLLGISRRGSRLGGEVLLFDHLPFADVSVDDVRVSDDLRRPFALDLSKCEGMMIQSVSFLCRGRETKDMSKKERNEETHQSLDPQHPRPALSSPSHAPSAPLAHGLIPIYRAPPTHRTRTPSSAPDGRTVVPPPDLPERSLRSRSRTGVLVLVELGRKGG
jgi:hypothetical protein